MSAPPKIAVFVFVLTIHLAILAFALPRLDLAAPAQSVTARPTSATIRSDQKSVSTDTKAIEKQPTTEADVHTVPVQHPQHDEYDNEPQAGEKRREPAVSHDLHQSSLAKNSAPATQQSELVATVLPAPAKPSLPISKDPVAEPSATAKPAQKSVTLTKAETTKVQEDLVSIPKPKPVPTTTAKPEPKPAAARRPTATSSTKAGSGRMSNLRPLKNGAR